MATGGQTQSRGRFQVRAAKTGKHALKRKRTGKKRSAVAAAGALMLIPALAAGEPPVHSTKEVALAGFAGGGLIGLTDPGDVGADGSLPKNDQLGAEVLALAGTPELLGGVGPGMNVPNGPLGIPGTMLQAYMRAAQTLAASTPNCHLEWPLLASIGRIESNHARGGRVDANGRTNPLILGPVLNGGGFAAISDTDGGRYDGDTRWDRAVGPMQFIPSTWKGYAADGNGDGVTDPNNIYDATVGSGKYLCSGGMDMANPANRAAAVFRYNHSNTYVATVLRWADSYARGVTPLPSTPVVGIEQLAVSAPRLERPQTVQPPRTTQAPQPPHVPRPPASSPGNVHNPSPSPSPTTNPSPPTSTRTQVPGTRPTQVTPSTTTPTTTTPPTTTTTPPDSCTPTPTATTTPPAPTTTSTEPDPCATDDSAQPATTTTGVAGSILTTTAS